MKGPLSGYRIIDLTTVVLGPYATRILGDLGADVVKVEPPEGDMLREIGPGKSPGMAPIHLALGSSKRSVVLDLKRPRARDALMRLVARADAFVHSMRPGALARLGLTYDEVRGVRGDIVYCGASGFGSGGPYAGRPAYDDLIQGMCGIADLMGRVTGGPPRYAPTIVADKTVGLFVANAVLAASAPSGANRRGTGDRSTDVRDDGVLRPHRAPLGTGRAARRRRARLRADARSEPPALPDPRRLHLHARLHRPPLAGVLRARRLPRAEHRSALCAHFRPDGERRGSLRGSRRPARGPDHRRMARGSRGSGDPGRPRQHPRRPPFRSSPRRPGPHPAGRPSERGRDPGGRSAGPASPALPRKYAAPPPSSGSTPSRCYAKRDCPRRKSTNCSTTARPFRVDESARSPVATGASVRNAAASRARPARQQDRLPRPASARLARKSHQLSSHTRKILRIFRDGRSPEKLSEFFGSGRQDAAVTRRTDRETLKA